MFDLDNLRDQFAHMLRDSTDDAKAFVLGQVARITVSLDDIRDSLDAMDSREEQFKEVVNFQAAGTEEVEQFARAGWVTQITRVAFDLAASGDVRMFNGAPDPTNLLFAETGDVFADGMNGYPGITSTGPTKLVVTSTQAGTVVIYGSRTRQKVDSVAQRSA